jgi:CubicO group peptidase (beta-lactamase class C family)
LETTTSRPHDERATARERTRETLQRASKATRGAIEDNVKRLAGVPLLFSPGTRWEYGLSIDVLGRLVEVVSGMPLDQFFRTRIFEPLGMKDTYFFPPENKLDRLAVAYTYYPEKGLQRFPDTPITEGPTSYSADYPYRGPKKLFSGGGGLSSTAADYLRFCQLMLQGGKFGDVRLLSRKSVELMSHDQLGKISADQAFGWVLARVNAAPTK